MANAHAVEEAARMVNPTDSNDLVGDPHDPAGTKEDVNFNCLILLEMRDESQITALSIERDA